MSKGYVPGSPHLTRLVVRAAVAFVAALFVSAALIRAPLQRAADPGHPPNPAKSAWFLLWIQELVSHSTLWMYPVLALAIALVALPWLRRERAEHASWFPAGERIVAAVAIALMLAVLVLTAVAFFLRGEQWRLVLPS